MTLDRDKSPGDRKAAALARRQAAYKDRKGDRPPSKYPWLVPVIVAVAVVVVILAIIDAVTIGPGLF
jgi:hypothetical protein